MSEYLAITLPAVLTAGELQPLLLTPAALLFFMVLILLVCCCRLKKSNKYLLEEKKHRNEHIAELEELLNTMAQLGKISYFISAAETSAQTDHSGIESKIAENYLSKIIPEDQERFQDNWNKLANGLLSSFTDSHTLLFKGKKRRHRSIVRTITLPGSRQKKVILSAMDVTEIEEQNINLANADSILKAIFDNLPGHIFLKNISSDFTYERCNPSYSGLIQKTPSDLVGKSDFELFERNLATRIRSCDLEVARTHNIADNRWYFTTPDGKEHVIRFILRTLKRSDGCEWLLGFGVDVTRQEYIAGCLRKRNKEMRMLMANLPYPAALFQNDLQLACATSAMQKALDLTLRGNQLPSCGTVFNCGKANTAECAAVHAADSGNICSCKYAVLNSQTMCMKVLYNKNNEISHYLMLPTEQAADAGALQ